MRRFTHRFLVRVTCAARAGTLRMRAVRVSRDFNVASGSGCGSPTVLPSLRPARLDVARFADGEELAKCARAHLIDDLFFHRKKRSRVRPRDARLASHALPHVWRFVERSVHWRSGYCDIESYMAHARQSHVLIAMRQRASRRQPSRIVHPSTSGMLWPECGSAFGEISEVTNVSRARFTRLREMLRDSSGHS